MRFLRTLTDIKIRMRRGVGDSQRGEDRTASSDKDVVELSTPADASLSREVPTSVAFTRRAWTALLSEVLKESGTETGGILLGYRDGSEWLVVESIDPGPDSVFAVAYFEYDQPYVTHLANRIRNYYARPLDVLGLWHRHPGSFDRFSGTDDETNLSFARMDARGAISGLVNVDPTPRFTLFHVAADPFGYMPVTHRVLGIDESERRAPLREADEIAQDIAKGASAASSIRQATRAWHAPDLRAMASRIEATIASDAGSAFARRLQEGERSEWSGEQLEACLLLLETDSQAFGARGISLDARLTDDSLLEVSAVCGDQRQPLCRLALVDSPSEGEQVICVMGARDPSALVPFASGLIWNAATNQSRRSDGLAEETP